MTAQWHDPESYDKGPGSPLSGTGRDVAAMTAVQHYTAAEQALARQALNQDRPDALRALADEARLHYLGAIAAALLERPSQPS